MNVDENTMELGVDPMGVTQILVKYHNPELTKIEMYDNGDWIDLRAAEEVHLNPGESKLISLGVSIKIPNIYEMWLAPRSSTFKKFGIIQTNGIGIIDNSYCGNNDIIKMPVYALRECHIPFNERIAQFRLIRRMRSYSYLNFKFTEVENLGTVDRNGFGSSDGKF